MLALSNLITSYTYYWNHKFLFILFTTLKVYQVIHMSRLVTKPTKMTVRPAKTQISLGIRPVWSESSLCAKWVAKGPSFHHADSEDADQTVRMPRLIWVFVGRKVILLVLSRGGSYVFLSRKPEGFVKYLKFKSILNLVFHWTLSSSIMLSGHGLTTTLTADHGSVSGVP